jgi:hypothetical protein
MTCLRSCPNVCGCLLVFRPGLLKVIQTLENGGLGILLEALWCKRAQQAHTHPAPYPIAVQALSLQHSVCRKNHSKLSIMQQGTFPLRHAAYYIQRAQSQTNPQRDQRYATQQWQPKHIIKTKTIPSATMCIKWEQASAKKKNKKH